MTRVTGNIHCIGGGELSHGGDAAIYLLDGGTEAALVDAGTGLGHRQVMRNLKQTGVDPASVRTIFLTHCHYDHTGGAEALRQQTGARLVAHADDARFLAAADPEVTAASWYGAALEPLTVDIAVEGSRQRFAVGSFTLELHHVPGHSPGSVVFTTESGGERILFGQDVHGPLHPALLSDREQYRRSLEYLLTLQADILCEGHFGIIRGRAEVADFIRSYL